MKASFKFFMKAFWYCRLSFCRRFPFLTITWSLSMIGTSAALQPMVMKTVSSTLLPYLRLSLFSAAISKLLALPFLLSFFFPTFQGHSFSRYKPWWCEACECRRLSDDENASNFLCKAVGFLGSISYLCCVCLVQGFGEGAQGVAHHHPEPPQVSSLWSCKITPSHTNILALSMM